MRGVLWLSENFNVPLKIELTLTHPSAIWLSENFHTVLKIESTLTRCGSLRIFQGALNFCGLTPQSSQMHLELPLRGH